MQGTDAVQSISGSLHPLSCSDLVKPALPCVSPSSQKSHSLRTGSTAFALIILGAVCGTMRKQQEWKACHRALHDRRKPVRTLIFQSSAASANMEASAAKQLYNSG